MEWSSVRFPFALLRSAKGCRGRVGRHRRRAAARDAAGVADSDRIIMGRIRHPPAGINIELVAPSRATRIVRLDHTRDRGSAANLESEGSIAPGGFRRRAHVGAARRDGHIRTDASILVRGRVAAKDRGVDIRRGRIGREGGRLSIQVHLPGADGGLLRRHPRGGRPDARPPRDVRFASSVLPLRVENDRERRDHRAHRGDALRERPVGDEPRHGGAHVELPRGREGTGGAAIVAGGERMGGGAARREGGGGGGADAHGQRHGRGGEWMHACNVVGCCRSYL